MNSKGIEIIKLRTVVLTCPRSLIKTLAIHGESLSMISRHLQLTPLFTSFILREADGIHCMHQFYTYLRDGTSECFFSFLSFFYPYASSLLSLVKIIFVYYITASYMSNSTIYDTFFFPRKKTMHELKKKSLLKGYQQNLKCHMEVTWKGNGNLV